MQGCKWHYVENNVTTDNQISSGKYGKVYHLEFDTDIDMHSIAMQ